MSKLNKTLVVAVVLITPLLLFCANNLRIRQELPTTFRGVRIRGPSVCRATHASRTSSEKDDDDDDVDNGLAYCQSVNTTKARYCRVNALGIQGSVHLWSMVKASSYNFLGYYLKHYICDAGIPAENMSFLLHANNANDTQRALAVFADYGIDVENNVNISKHFDEDVKTGSLNRHIASLPEDAWLTYPDLDEFYHFPCTSLDSPLSEEWYPPGLTCIGGRMIDRLPPLDSPIPAIDPSRSLTSQYPVCVKVRSEGEEKIVQGDNYKNLLFPVQVTDGDKWWRARLLNPHRLVYELNGVQKDIKLYKQEEKHGNASHIHCSNRGYIDHYSWTAEQIDSALAKKELWSDYPYKVVTYNEMLNLVTKDNSTGLWSFTENATERLDRSRICCHSNVPYDFKEFPV